MRVSDRIGVAILCLSTFDISWRSSGLSGTKWIFGLVCFAGECLANHTLQSSALWGKKRAQLISRHIRITPLTAHHRCAVVFDRSTSNLPRNSPHLPHKTYVPLPALCLQPI